MHVLMLGWEFPPFITGGLGTACYGLTRAMDRRGTKVTFVIPKSAHGEQAKHVTLLTPSDAMEKATQGGEVRWVSLPPRRAAAPDGDADATHGSGPVEPPTRSSAVGTPFEHVRFIEVPAGFSHPYQRSADEGPVGETSGNLPAGSDVPNDSNPSNVHGANAPAPRKGAEGDATDAEMMRDAVGRGSAAGQAGSNAADTSDYEGDMIATVEQYAMFCLVASRKLNFDVVHAHDWMTYPAGLLIAQATGKPLVVHIHSTEFDRSGEHVNQQIYDIERRGMHGAMRVVAVSQLTKNLVVQRYGVPEHKVEVVYNGVDLEPKDIGIRGIRSKDRIVLYFGRITYQKGPEYFIHAAKRVLDVMPDVKFVVAGSGDQAKRMIEMAADLGIGHKVLFTGFLRGADIKRVFNLADLYVMPSVSEPFGIAPLEAMSHNVPVLISRTSGVSEVLSHALKVDFWDIDDMANKIIAVLKYPPLHRTLQEHGAFEVRRITWDGAAERCEKVYRTVQGEMTGHAAER